VGDLGRLDEEGYLFIDGRRDDLIITGGVNVYPAEVESVLSEVPEVAEIAVFGVPDEEWGQRVCAAVVPVGSASLSGAGRQRLVDALVAFAATHLAGYKRPKQWDVLDELPRTATGKVQRNLIPDALGS
jgi:long-chain acyl-CoA synthetase